MTNMFVASPMRFCWVVWDMGMKLGRLDFRVFYIPPPHTHTHTHTQKKEGGREEMEVVSSIQQKLINTRPYSPEN